MKVSNPALHTQVQNWAQNQGIDKPLHDLSLRQLQQAGRSVGADLGDMVQLREELVANAAGTAMDAGQASATDRDASVGGMPMGMGGSQDINASPMLARHTFDAGKGGIGKGKGKGVGFADADSAMGGLGNRYEPKTFCEHDGYRGGDASIDVFYKSGYSISDAEALMKAMPNLDTLWDAKELIGAKADSGFTTALKDLGITPNPFDAHEEMDAFNGSGYDIYDARQALGRLPFLSNMEEAKRYIGLKVINGREDVLTDVGIHGSSRPPMELYFKSGYNYDDAEAVMKHFDFPNVGEAKEYIGDKIAQGNEYILANIGVKPNDENFENILAFHKSGYSFEDAEVLMDMYSLNDVGEAKELIGEKVMSGFTRSLESAGITPFADLHDGLNAFSRSPYTEADARALVAMTNMFEDVQSARAYIGEKVINGAEGFLKDLGITRSKFDTHEQLNAFGNSDYTADDVQLAVDRFSFLGSSSEAREYIGLKIINGTEDILLERGIGVGGKGFDDFDYNPKGGYNPKGNFYAGKGYYADGK